VTIRIPRRVNAVLDRIARRPLAALAAAAAVITGPLAVLNPTVPLVLGFGMVTLGAGLAWRQSTITILRTDRDHLLGLDAAKDEELRRLRAGEAAAPTQEITHIGDHGELL